MKKKLCMALCLSMATITFAQDANQIEQLDSVMIDTKIKRSRKNSGKVVTKITSEVLERSKGKSVAQLLNEVSGIEINGSRSNDGQNLGYFVRGGRNRQVVIMVDGVQLSDPSQISNDYDLRLIPAHTIKEIEVVKGASSVLYGSGAATAVISITTKTESKAPIAATFSNSVGTNKSSESNDAEFEEFTSHIGLNGTLNRFFYDVKFGNRYVDGLSAVAAPEGEERFEKDAFSRFDGRLKLGYQLSKAITISRFFSFDKFKAGFDNFDYTDANNQSITEQQRTGGQFNWKFNKGNVTINDSYSWIEREISSAFPSKFDSKNYTVDGYLSYRVTSQISGVIGVNYSTSSFNSFSIPFGETDFAQDVEDGTAKFNIVDPYINVTYTSDFGLNLNAGARLNVHSDYGNHVVYSLNPSYVFTIGSGYLKVLGSYSTAYITPSLFQLHDPQYGNTALQPEENTTLEGGLAYSLGSNFNISGVFFRRDEKNYVDFVTVDPDLLIFQYQNISEAFSASGVEVVLRKRFGERLNFSANYTNTQADERFALRIPEHKLNTNLRYQVLENSSIGVSYQYNSDREDSFFNSDTFETENITLNGFGVLDLNISHQLTKNVTLFANVSNVLDEEYEEVYRFQTRGRNIRGGFTLNF